MNYLRAYTSAYTGWTMMWDSFRVDNASQYLREEGVGTCTADLKLTFAGFGKPMFGSYSWYAVQSNFVFEKGVLNDINTEARVVVDTDMTKAISQLPTKAVEVQAAPLVSPHLMFTSEPVGAVIEIDGEFIGNTPTTVTVKPGKLAIRLKKTGFQSWSQTINVNAGDKRTISAELEKLANPGSTSSVTLK